MTEPTELPGVPPNRSYDHFGSAVKGLLLDRAQSMRSLAHDIDIDIAYIMRVGKGQPPSMKVLHRVADVLGVDPEYFAEYREAIVRDYLAFHPEIVDEIYGRLPEDWLERKKKALAQRD